MATLHEFRAEAARAIANPRLQAALEGATRKFRDDRRRVMDDPADETLRDQLKAIRAATIANLGEHLERFEAQASAAGTRVHWARDAQEATRIVLDIAAGYGIDRVVKSKSMAGEEIHLNQALEAGGVTPVETDLGEWIIQLAGEGPSHIIAPAIHKTREQVAELLEGVSGKALSADDIPGLTAEARRFLREQFLKAGMGLSGANMGIAETGSIVLVTNEGNGRMVTSLPPVYVAIMGIEKVVPTWRDAGVWLSLLARSATGQRLSVYTTIQTGPRREGEPDGPQEMHVILLDNGRSSQIGTPYEEVLQCIRCGACLNVCPVYREAGGHAYKSPYSGPIGAVISPLLFGLESFGGLPHASSLCGACLEVCPVRIDLPRMLLELRRQEVRAKVLPLWERLLERLVAFGFARPGLYTLGGRLARLALRAMTTGESARLPRRLDVTQGRALPPGARRSFHDLWKDGQV